MNTTTILDDTWVRENGYSYIRYFEKHGELWVKEGKKK